MWFLFWLATSAPALQQEIQQPLPQHHEYVLVNECVDHVDITEMICSGSDPKALNCRNQKLVFKPGRKLNDCVNVNVVRDK